MQKLPKLFFSPTVAVLLLVAYASSMAAATFIENDFGTQTAKAVVYNTWWFELLMLGLGLNFIGNIYKYQLFRKGKIPILLFHIAFIIILIGAGITRHFSYEGIMRIREGASSNIILSDKNFLQLHMDDGAGNSTVEWKSLSFSPLQDNDFSFEKSFSGKTVRIKHESFIADAAPKVIKDENTGTPMLELVVSTGKGRETIFLESGKIKAIGAHQHRVSFQNETPDGINITVVEGKLFVRSSHDIDYFKMADQSAGKLTTDSLQELKFQTLYRSGDFAFVPMSFEPMGKIVWASQASKAKDNEETLDDLLFVNVTVGDITKEVQLTYRQGTSPAFASASFDGVNVKLAYGATPIKTPFSIALEDFQLERYPGSTSPSSYASEVVVIDGDKKIPSRIFMNNVLDYQGYRFFQASYDSDEKGTVLSVSHDRIGTWVTYLGYFLMSLGMLWTLFGKQSRFAMIQKKLKNLKLGKAAVLLLAFNFFSISEGNAAPKTNIDSLVQSQVMDEYQASLFGRLMVQDLDGRIKPVNTLASEFLRKITRKTYYKYGETKLDANQVFIGLHAYPEVWSQIPLIKIDQEKGARVYDKLEFTEQGRVAFNELVSPEGEYLLFEAVEEANAKKPAERGEFDKEMLKVDERFNILFNVFSGNYLKIFPKRDDESKTWYSFNHHFDDFPEEDGRFAKSILSMYFTGIEEAKLTGDWSEVETIVAYIKKYQNILAPELIPPARRVEAEIWYNQLNLYFWLFLVYWTLGLVLLAAAVLHIFTKRKFVNYLLNVSTLLTLVAFIVHTANLILRWYVAQHAPWSNGYEMITFVGWSLMLFGIIFHRKSDFVLPLATLFAGTLLFVSYLDWLSPEITNLMPVLKSYWLKIHVATIVSSYAPLALSALLGLMALLLMIFKTEKSSSEMDLRIKELTYINELSMTIGLFILAIGTFLGGVWANESWGRYWAWDPKETWALISIIVYATVLHLHLIPSLKNSYVLNVASVFAFFSIIMTSFGVNYYLTGLHSYATGDPVPIPNFIYVTVVLVISISVGAYFRIVKLKEG